MRKSVSIQNAKIDYGKIYDSALHLFTHVTPENTYKSIIKEAKRLTGAKHGSLFLVEDDELKRVYASSPVFNLIRPRKRGFTYRAYKKQEPYILPRKKSIEAHPEIAKLNLGSDIGVPLIYNNETIGVLTLCSDKKKIFSPYDLEVLQVFSRAISLAMKKMQLYTNTQKSVDERDLFISIAAHELKTPLTTVSIYSQLLLRKDSETRYSDTQIKMKLSSEIRRLTNLVNELLQINQIKSGSLQFSFKKCDLCSVVEGAVTSFENIHVNHPVCFKNELRNKYCFVYGDYDKLFQVITNLLNNAAKFSPKYSPIDIVLKYENSKYLLEVSDHGPGIPRKDLPRIFERFYKGNSKKKDGLGLGLYLVKNVIDRHEGKISVSSKLRKGTTFTITLPMYTNGEKPKMNNVLQIFNTSK